MYITQNLLLCSYIHCLHMGVFPHECIILWVVKTTSLSFPVEYAIASIVCSILILTIYSIFILRARFTYYTLK